MTPGHFLRTLYDTGRLRVLHGDGSFTLQIPSTPDTDLVTLDRAIRATLAHSAPPLLPAVAQWAANLLYGCCKCLAFRDVTAEQVERIVSNPALESASPAAAYSADLALQYLPDLLKLARGLSPGDPLVAGMITLGKSWPLSSVGIPEVDDDPAVSPAAFIDDPSLATLYIDRIIDRKARGRLTHPRTRTLARAALGLYPQLAPDIHQALELLEIS